MPWYCASCAESCEQVFVNGTETCEVDFIYDGDDQDLENVIDTNPGDYCDSDQTRDRVFCNQCGSTVRWIDEVEEKEEDAKESTSPCVSKERGFFKEL